MKSYFTPQPFSLRRNNMDLMPRSGGTLEIYDVKASKRCIKESEELTSKVKAKALMAIDKSPQSKGKDFPTFNILFVLDQEFAFHDKTVVSVLEVIEKASNLIKTIRIKKC